MYAQDAQPRRRSWRGGLAVATACLSVSLAQAQLSPESWWPKFQRDAQNSGYVPALGLVRDVHVEWVTQLGEPVANESHATPVLSSDNSRLYVGVPGSTLVAVDVADGMLAWTITLGDGTGAFCTSAVVAADNSIYVGTWDSSAPVDGFCKVRDNGDMATLVWSFPMKRMLASPTITSSGLIIVGGQHETDGWGYFAIEDLGDTYSLAWMAGQLGDPGDPGSIGAVGASPALSLDDTWVFGGSWENKTFWQIDAATGDEQARLPLDYYCYAASPVVSDDGYAFIGEGMSFADPDEDTQGKLYAFGPDELDVMAQLDSHALHAGHLMGGTAALYRRVDGRTRLYVPANGYGDTHAALVAVEFDADEGTLHTAWETSLGNAAVAYPQAVVTQDEVVYVLGPVDQQLYAIRGGNNAAKTLWMLGLDDITRVDGWVPTGQRGPQGVIVGPDGTIYWNAVDGYLYAIRGWYSGDFDGDGQIDGDDLNWMVAALVDAEGYELRFPEINPETVGDLDGNGRLDFFDLNRMLEVLLDG